MRSERDPKSTVRTEQKRLDEPSRERYSKYLKALLQVGDTPSDAHATVLRYAAEIVPEQNPYRLHAGDRLTVRCIVDGRPWAGKVVFAAAGTWYVKFVAMVEVADASANYESKWSTLSFTVGGSPPPRRVEPAPSVVRNVSSPGFVQGQVRGGTARAFDLTECRAAIRRESGRRPDESERPERRPE